MTNMFEEMGKIERIGKRMSEQSKKVSDLEARNSYWEDRTDEERTEMGALIGSILADIDELQCMVADLKRKRSDYC